MEHDAYFSECSAHDDGWIVDFSIAMVAYHILWAIHVDCVSS